MINELYEKMFLEPQPLNHITDRLYMKYSLPIPSIPLWFCCIHAISLIICDALNIYNKIVKYLKS